MPISNESMNKDLYKFLKTRGFDPIPKDSDGQTIPVPNDAEVFKFTFKQDGKDIGPAWVTIDGNQELRVYYDDKLSDLAESSSSDEFDDSWTGFLKQLKMFAKRRQLGFDTENQDHLSSDMAQRSYMKKKENISEGYYPMGKNASYNDSIPTVKIVLQHTRQIQEGEQRYRNIARIFLENAQGERILAPTTRPGIAQVYARHLAEGGVPNDDRWNHIKGLCEEYSKMAGFVRAVRGNQFNESAQRLVEAGLNHYQSLRESLGKLRGHRGYNAYFESWTPTLMEDDTDNNTLNELFVQETLDPRIESVMPILSKLSKNLGEMKEVNELAEWVDSLTEAPGAETLAHNQSTAEKNLKAFGLAEEGVDEGLADIAKKVGSTIAKKVGSAGKKALDVIAPDDEELLKQLQQRAGVPASAQHGKPRMAKPSDEDHMTEGNMDDEEQGMAEDLGPEQKRVGQLGPTEPVGKNEKNLRGKLVGASESFINTAPQAVVSEMDSEGYKGTRDDYELGKGKEHTGTPVKAKDTAKDAEEVLNKAMDKAHEEGQEDLDYIKKVLGK